MGLVDVIAPPRLGRDFRVLLSSQWLSNLGDGLSLAAGPLLINSLTDDAALIALGATFQWLPPLLFGLPAGALSDRLDRRRLVVGVNLVRVVLLAGLAATVAAGAATIPLVLATLFLLGTCETFADNTLETVLPMLVHRDEIALGNARLMAGQVTLNQLAGPPLGGAFFVLGAAVPFASQCVLVLAGVVLIARVRLPPVAAAAGGGFATLRRDVAEGFRWAWRHAAVRTLVLTIFSFNLTFGAAFSVLVVYATRRLGMGEAGFGLLSAALAVGGIAGSLGYGWLSRRISLGNLMRIGLIIETLTHLGLALTTRPAVALAIFVVFGAHAFVWATTSTTIRQRAVPMALQGRVGAVDTVGTFGGLVIGSGFGGLLAQRFDVTVPFWFAFVGSAVFVVLIWSSLRHLSNADDAPTPAP